MELMLTSRAGHFPVTNVREIDISNNRLRGNSLNTLALFSNLEVLRASGNMFSGPFLGSRFSTLANLTVLDLSDNYFTGTLPLELAALEQLELLNLSSNDWTGTVPMEWSSLPELELLNITKTLLTGEVPTEFCDRMKPPDSVQILADCGSLECCN